MKAIAEYFRDLAADDRYFGAEPPQPDVEMLARIAEREVARRVEARMSDSGVHLRAESATVALTAAEAVHGAVQNVQTTADDQATMPDAQTNEDIAPSDNAVTGNVPETPQETPAVETAKLPEEMVTADHGSFDDAEHGDDSPESASLPDEPDHDVSISTDNSEIDTVTEHPDTETAVAAVVSEQSVFDEEFEEDAEATTAEPNIMSASWDYPMSGLTSEKVEAAEDEKDPAERVQQGMPIPPGIAPSQPASLMPTPPTEPVAEAVSPPTDADSGSITDKLRRIREVVARNQSSGLSYEEDQHAEDFDSSASTSAEIDQPAVVQKGTFDEEESFEEFAADWEADDEDLQSWDDVMGDADVFDELEEDLSAEASREKTVAASGAIQKPDSDAENSDRIDTSVSEASSPAASIGAMPVPPKSTSLPEQSSDDTAPAAPSAPARRRVRVVKVKRAEIEKAVDSGALEEASEQDNANDDILSESEENELLRELAEVEAELTAENTAGSETDMADNRADLSDDFDLSEDDMAEFDDDAAAADASAARLLQQASGAEEDALDRLMAKADSQMEEPESTSRRSAFSHLRAAVAATKADDKLSEAAKAPGDEDYRTDLAAAVKPRRPVADGSRTSRPNNERLAPLKLVAEQRVDSPQANAGPILPRRVKAAAPAADEESGGFAQYAEARGARDLPQVLEAAASYLSFVEGRAQFSRPQLMTKVRQLGLDDFTREDGLRHFGQLLRAGKIEKIKGGRFTVSEDIGFRPDPNDQRQAG